MKTEQESVADRPKWLTVTLACLSGWLVFVISFFVYSLSILYGIEALFGLDGIPGVQGVVFVVIIAVFSLFTAILLSRWQHRLLGGRSLRTNYIVLGILIVIALTVVPAPFTYTII